MASITPNSNIKSSLTTSKVTPATNDQTKVIPEVPVVATEEVVAAPTASETVAKAAATVTDNAPVPGTVVPTTSNIYVFDTNTNTYLKTVKKLIDDFDGTKIPVENIGMNLTMSAWQAIKNLITRTKDEDFTLVMDTLNNLVESGKGKDKCFSDNRKFYYSNSFIASGKISKDDLRAYELMISAVTLLSNKVTRRMTSKQIVLEEAFKYLRNNDATQRVIQYYTS